MIRFLFLIIIAAIVLSIAFFQFKTVPMSKKIAVLGGGVLAAAIGILLQNSIAWYIGLLALVAVSLAASLVYMKVLEKEEVEKQLLAEERKERRKTLLSPVAPEVHAPDEQTADEPKSVETISANIPATVLQPKLVKEPEPERETVPPSFGMQSIQPAAKESSREQ